MDKKATLDYLKALKTTNENSYDKILLTLSSSLFALSFTLYNQIYIGQVVWALYITWIFSALSIFVQMLCFKMAASVNDDLHSMHESIDDKDHFEWKYVSWFESIAGGGFFIALLAFIFFAICNVNSREDFMTDNDKKAVHIANDAAMPVKAIAKSRPTPSQL